MRGGGCTHEPASHIETRASRPTDTLRHVNETITQSHCEVQVGIRSVKQHMGILTWAHVHAWSHTHTRVCVHPAERKRLGHGVRTHRGPHLLMAASSLRWCLRAAPESFLRVCL